MSYGVTFVSPTWCYGGLESNVDFPNEGPESMSGYSSGPGLNSIRLYSRVACESLGGADNIWSANGECTYVLAPDGEGGYGRYNASTVCAGLNNAAPQELIVAALDDLSFDCPKQEDKVTVLIIVGFLGLVLGYYMKK
jgi:hypothetical protein